MDYSDLVAVYKELESTQSNLEKIDTLAGAFAAASDDELERLVKLGMGRIFTAWKETEIGISSKLMVRAIAKVTGESESRVEDEWRDTGDLGNTTENLLADKKQQTFATQELTVEKVHDNLKDVAEYEGSGSQERKIDAVAELLSIADPEEAKYVVRTVLRNMRVGVGEGTVRDALVEAFFTEDRDSEEYTEAKQAVQHGYDVTNDFGVVAVTAKNEGLDGLAELEMELFRPVNAMLAQKVDSLAEGFETVGSPAAIDYKYDGMRAQIHKKGEEVKVFTRRLEDVTEQFPDVREAVEENLDSDACIIDVEIVAYDPEDGSLVPFQKLSKRIKRKYDIRKMVGEIPVEVRPFDLIYEGGAVIEERYSDRWDRLSELVSEEEQVIRLADHAVTDDEEEANELWQRALAEGHEGIMMKNMEAVYKPGSRVGYMVKLKPVMETLDLAIIGAEWSEGRRSGWLGSLKLGCLNEQGEYEEVGRLATGLTDEQLQEITDRLEPLIVEEDGRQVTVRPEVIIEAEFEEIQKSPTYSSGFALRFPRLKRFRDDKEDADGLERVKKLYEEQS